jgi:urease accessory protein
MIPKLRAAACAAVLVAMPGAAFAHPGAGDAHGFLHGFAHPVGGLDHVLAMVAVGLFAARLGGRALWLVPASFVLMMVAGAAWALAGHGLSFVEAGIALSVVAFGLVLALGRSLPDGIAAALVGVFAVFHGYAHGAEIPADASGFAYGAGFVLATALLHASGIVLSLGVGRLADGRILRLSGAAIAMAGGAILSGYL